MKTGKKKNGGEFIPMNFAGLGNSLSSLEKSKVVVIPVPYDLTTSYLPGARRGPIAIIEASKQLELFDDEIKKEIASIGIHTMGQLEQVATNPEQMCERVREAVSWVIDSKKFPVVLGGEHTVSYGAVKAVAELV